MVRLILGSFVAQACFYQKFLLIAGLDGCLCHGIALGQRKAQLEFLDDVVAYATAAEVLFADGHTVGVVLQHIVEIVHGPLVDYKHRLAFALLLSLLVGELLLHHLDVVFLGQPVQSLGVGDLLVLHEETDGCAAFPAHKAVTDVLGRRHNERRVAVVVERAKSFVVDAAFAQRHKLAHHVNNACCIKDSVNCRSVYHSLYFWFACVYLGCKGNIKN